LCAIDFKRKNLAQHTSNFVRQTELASAEPLSAVTVLPPSDWPINEESLLAAVITNAERPPPSFFDVSVGFLRAAEGAAGAAE